VLKTISRHVDTGEVLPEQLYLRLKDADKFLSGWGMMRQLYFSTLDIALHSRTPPGGVYSAEWVKGVQSDIASRYQVQQPLPEDGFLCSFGHIFSGGYSAGYYSYKWAEVMSEDAYAAFEEAGIDEKGVSHPDVVKVGRRFRDTVLAWGGSKHASEVFEAFRGRGPSVKPLLNRYFDGIDA
jgi:oligopeptidase A